MCDVIRKMTIHPFDVFHTKMLPGISNCSLDVYSNSDNNNNINNNNGNDGKLHLFAENFLPNQICQTLNFENIDFVREIQTLTKFSSE